MRHAYHHAAAGAEAGGFESRYARRSRTFWRPADGDLHDRQTGFPSHPGWTADVRASAGKMMDDCAPYTTALTTISTRVSPSSVTARHARIGGLLRSAHSSQARFISGFRFMSAMYTMAVRNAAFVGAGFPQRGIDVSERALGLQIHVGLLVGDER